MKALNPTRVGSPDSWLESNTNWRVILLRLYMSHVRSKLDYVVYGSARAWYLRAIDCKLSVA
jgi:hypothetical protein